MYNKYIQYMIHNVHVVHNFMQCFSTAETGTILYCSLADHYAAWFDWPSLQSFIQQCTVQES